MRPAARHAVKGTVRTLSRAATRLVAVDVTGRPARGPYLVVAPHPDDETLGCGALIARLRSLGIAVDVVFVTGGGASPAPEPMTDDCLVALRRDEARFALDALDVPSDRVRFWDYPDGHVADHVERLGADLAALLDETASDHVLVTSTRDRHPDHAAVGWATRSAVARRSPTPAIHEFAIWQRIPAWTMGRQFLRARTWAARPRIVRSARFATAKAAAIGAYRSQLPHFPPGFVEDFTQPVETFWPVPAASDPSGQAP